MLFTVKESHWSRKLKVSGVTLYFHYYFHSKGATQTTHLLYYSLKACLIPTEVCMNHVLSQSFLEIQTRHLKSAFKSKEWNSFDFFFKQVTSLWQKESSTRVLLKSKHLLMSEEESTEFSKLTNNNNFLSRKSIDRKHLLYTFFFLLLKSLWWYSIDWVSALITRHKQLL